MLFNNPAFAGQCNLTLGVFVSKALNPEVERVMPSGAEGLEQCRHLSPPLAELLGSISFPVAREKFCSWRAREEQRILHSPTYPFPTCSAPLLLK